MAQGYFMDIANSPEREELAHHFNKDSKIAFKMVEGRMTMSVGKYQYSEYPNHKQLFRRNAFRMMLSAKEYEGHGHAPALFLLYQTTNAHVVAL